MNPLFSTGKDDWATPEELFGSLHQEFSFILDVAANADNTKLPCWYGPGSAFTPDSFSLPWWHINWCNPPYTRGIQRRFIEKAASERLAGKTTVMLLPARTDTKVFHQHIWDVTQHRARHGVEVRFLKGRVKFVGAKAGAPFPSMVVVFRG